MQSYKASVLALLGILFVIAGCGPEFVVMNSVNEEKALLAIDRIEDQQTLKQAAYHGHWSAVRRKAFRKITDQKILGEMAIRKGFLYLSPPFNLEAAKQIVDPNILYRLATQGEDGEVRAIAIDKISDQGMLEQLAQNAPHSDVRSIATKRIDNAALLERIAVNDESGIVRLEAVNRVTNQDLLEKIAINDEYSFVRSRALSKVTNQDVLEKAFYLEKKEGNSQSDIIKRLDNQEILTEIVLSEVKRQDGQEISAWFALRDRQELYRLCAIGGIKDTSILETVVHNDESENAVVFALARLIALEGRLVDNKEKKKKTDAYLRRLYSMGHFSSDYRQLTTEYRQRIGPLADIIYLLEDPQLAQYWGKPRITVYTHWSDKEYGRSHSSRRMTLQIETIHIEIKFEKKPALHIIISGRPGSFIEEFEIRPSDVNPTKKNYATLSWRYFVHEFGRQVKAQNMPSFELKNTNRYQELLKANPTVNQ